jgi:4-hydroxybenzoate polyprenyltransferase/phosphoserine phosphatase
MKPMSKRSIARPNNVPELRSAAVVPVERPSNREPPLVVDLDGTLVRTNLFYESVVAMVRRAPATVLLLVPWLLRGRAALKRAVAERATIDAEVLPYRDDVCAFVCAEASKGRRIVLATASDELVAREVARHLGFFDCVIASDGRRNLKGAAKRDRLRVELGDRQFDYVGDSRADLPVWAAARKSIVVGGARLRADAMVRAPLDRAFASGRKPLAAARALRPQHWLKNVLVFVPLLAAQRLDDWSAVRLSVLAFTVFCMVASALYLVNDVLDLSADRRHPLKRLRPIAAGDLSILGALTVAAVLLAVGGVLASRVTAPFAAAAALYAALSISYSVRLKHVVLLDVIVLASFYVLRIVAGAAAIDVPVSRWLLGFSMFACLSLALVKRYTEIVSLRSVNGDAASDRGYRASDAALLTAMGIASGFLAAVILALYVDSSGAAHFYAHSDRLWLVCPVFLYWVSHLWLTAEREHMGFDPVVFAVTNRTSLVLIAVMAGLVLSAL